jgi:hypothetical protein
MKRSTEISSKCSVMPWLVLLDLAKGVPGKKYLHFQMRKMLLQKRLEDLRRIHCFTLVDGRLCTLLLGCGALRPVVVKARSEELR